MNANKKQILFLLISILLLASACTSIPGQPGVDPQQVEDQVSTWVAMTLTWAPTNTPASTNTPIPTGTASPTASLVLPTPIPLENIVVPTAKPGYACNVVRRDPADDTQIRRDSQFDIEWTLMNTGTQQWEKGTYLVYQDGPKMTDTQKLELPRLKPGETYDIALRATAPSERELQITVWAVVGPGKEKDSQYWMCYPYIRIVVTK